MAGLRRPRRRRVVLAILLGAFVVAGIAGARSGIFARDRAHATTVQDAIRRFRQGDRRARSLEGVYTFATTGRESVDALGGAHHAYPSVTTVTALRIDCGLRLDWRALRERSTTWTLCSTPAGIELRSVAERHHFFWQADTTTYACTAALLLPGAGVDVDPLAARRFSCTTRKGAEQGKAVSLGRVTLTVGGRTVTAEHVRTTGHLSGANQGWEITDWWLDTATGLPLRISLGSRTSRKTIVGATHYREDADLRLVSLTPRR